MTRTSRNWFVLMFAMAAMVLLSCGTVWAANGDTVVVNATVTYGQTEARKMLDLINDFRTGSDAWYWNEDNQTKTVCTDLGKLKYDYELEKIAMKRAAEIALHFGHDRPNGQEFFTAYNSYSAAGENIAAGYTSYTDVFVAWQEIEDDYDGQGHRRNMLDGDFTTVGIGHLYYKGYHFWVQEFRSPGSSQSETVANDEVTNVNVEVLAENIVNISSSVSSYNFDWASGEELPELLITLKKSWPSGSACPINASEDWTVQDPDYVTISGSKLVGKAPGSTNLTTVAGGETITVPITILPVSLESAMLTISRTIYDYTGSIIIPSITVTADGKTLTNSDYNIICTNNIKPGTATIEAKGKGLYTGSVSRTFAIVCTHRIRNIVIDKAVAATRIETGLTEGFHCSACQKVLIPRKTTDRLPFIAIAAD